MIQGGIYVFLMFDYYMGSRVLLAVVLAELALVVYVYGTNHSQCFYIA